jgi:hypothetical protein
VEDPAGSNATAGLALRVTGTHKPLHHDKLLIPLGWGGDVRYTGTKLYLQTYIQLCKIDANVYEKLMIKETDK